MKSIRRRRSFSTKKRRNPYEMETRALNRVALSIAAGTTPAAPSVDLFVLHHPRQGWATDPTQSFNRVPPLARGSVLKGIHHRIMYGYVPLYAETPTATAIGLLRMSWAIQRLPSAPNTLEPLLVPNLFDSTDSVNLDANDTVSARTLYHGTCYLPVVDGSMSADIVTRSTLENAIVREPRGQAEWVHTRSACRMGMEQGLYLNIQCVSPFGFGADATVIGLDAQFYYGVKQLLSGPNAYI